MLGQRSFVTGVLVHRRVNINGWTSGSASWKVQSDPRGGLGRLRPSAIGRVPQLLLVMVHHMLLVLLLLVLLPCIAAAAAAARHDPALLREEVVQALHALRVDLRCGAWRVTCGGS